MSYPATTFTYNNRGRIKTAIVGSSTTTYVYNALGQRIKKSGGVAGTVVNVYDEVGHLLGEYNGTGGLVQETVWLGDIPVASLRPGTPAAIYYVHANQLGIPVAVTRPSDNKFRWQWHPDAFGVGAPNENPQSLGAFTYNLRFPGQYFDSETGQYYNYFRDYDSLTGRYVESDPVGQVAGPGTYSYAMLNPLNFSDSLGLDVMVIGGGYIGGSVNVPGHVADAVTGAGVYSYGNNTDIGSDVLAYLQSQSQIRNQVVTYIPTTPLQDASIIDFYKQFPDRNSIGILDNCAVRTSEALHAGKVPVEGSIFPGDLSRQAGMVPGATQFFIPQGGPIPQALLDLLPAFTKH